MPANVRTQSSNVGVQPVDVASCSNAQTDDKFICKICLKTFKNNWNLTKHTKKICKGPISALECRYCNSKFTCRSSKSHHLRTCKVKKGADSKALIVCTPHEEPVPATAVLLDAPVATIGQHIGTQNNNIKQQIVQQNNIEAQTNVQHQTINIVVYGEDEISFRNDHVNVKEFKKKLIPGNEMIEPERLTRVIREYTRELLANKSNQCVKKTNLKLAHSSVHTGDNQWETRPDKQVYPLMMNNIANNFGDFLGTYFKPKIYSTLMEFSDYLASNGYCADDEKSKIVDSCYRILVKELKFIMYDLNKS